MTSKSGSGTGSGTGSRSGTFTDRQHEKDVQEEGGSLFKGSGGSLYKGSEVSAKQVETVWEKKRLHELCVYKIPLNL